MRLKEIRTKKGLTQFELAKHVNIQPNRISMIENGKTDFKFQQAIRAAQFLGVSLEELAGLNKADVS